MLVLENLHAGIDNKEILHGITLSIKKGEIHAIMGPNGSGKTTLAMSLMGNPSYKLKVKSSKLKIDGKIITNLLPEERAKRGLFVSFQNPVEITGVSLLAFLRTAAKALRPDEKKPLSEFKKELSLALTQVGLSEEFMQRFVNEGFSGGERKRAEIAQLIVLKPKFAVLDEIDSGLDIDSLRIVAQAIREIVTKKNMGILIITHYQRILHFLKPDIVHIMINGEIKKSGKMPLVRRIEKDGYAAISE